MKNNHKNLYAKIVKTLSKFSSADRLRVGSILIKNGRIVSTGYNGHLPGRPHKKIIIDNHDLSTIHSEQNCLLHCAKEGISTNGCEMFVTHFPCQHCLKSIIMSGIKKVYYLEDYRNDENPFKDELEIEKVDYEN